MFATLTKGAIAASLLAMPIAASAQYGDRDYRDRESASRQELRRDRERLRDERQDVREARQYGSPRDVREERRDVREARRELRQDRRDYRSYSRYDYNRPDPRYGRYYADNYYRDGGYYQPRRLRASDRIYRGRDNRYYCRRDDGTTGLIIGGLAGGVLGNVISPGGSTTLGTILGGAGGALLGRSIDRNDGVRCR